MGCLGLEGLNVASEKLVLRQVNPGKQNYPAPNPPVHRHLLVWERRFLNSSPTSQIEVEILHLGCSR
jgi:hypothetical protein